MPHPIPKNPLSNATTPSFPPAARCREDRNKDIALYHAQLLQQRKNVEALILASTETLLDSPSSPNADPAHPSYADSTLIRNSLWPFQPSDYDSLIEERNINKQCGYVLCPRSNRLEKTKAKYRILHSGGKSRDALKFVERQALEHWCSDDCGKRALYIRVQLNEEPAWTRSRASEGNIVLLEGNPTEESGDDREVRLTHRIHSLDLGHEEKELAAQLEALAIERGDSNAPSGSTGLAELDIWERAITEGETCMPKLPPMNEKIGGVYDSVEGYRPQLSGKKLREEKLHQEVDFRD